VLYVGVDLATSASEVFGEAGTAALCPSWRVAKLQPVDPIRVFDLTMPGAAMAIGALPGLADAAEPRELTQSWARAIYEDDPVGRHVDGIRYRSAYNGDLALALWDSSTSIRTVANSAGKLADAALTEPAMLDRLAVALTQRRISFELIDSADCPSC
jgi:hypothetical protein